MYIYLFIYLFISFVALFQHYYTPEKLETENHITACEFIICDISTSTNVALDAAIYHISPRFQKLEETLECGSR